MIVSLSSCFDIHALKIIPGIRARIGSMRVDEIRMLTQILLTPRIQLIQD